MAIVSLASRPLQTNPHHNPQKVNQIYLSHLTSRVPILSGFTMGHLPQNAGEMPFGDVFDIPRVNRIHTHM